MRTTLIHDENTLTGLDRAVREHLPAPIRRQAWPTTPAPAPWRDEEPTLVRDRPRVRAASSAAPTEIELDDELEPMDATEAWMRLLQDPAVGIAAATAVLSFGLSAGSACVGFVLGMIVG